MITAIRGDNKNERLHALSNFHVIAKALGSIRTRNELIPYTLETTDLDEKSLKKIAKELGIMLKEVGGVSEIQCLFKALKTICENEDSSVRNAAVNSLIQIGKSLSSEEFNKSYSQFIQDISKDNWYPLRCCGATISCRLYNQISKDDKQTFHKLFEAFCKDQSIMVRRSFAQSLPYLIQFQCPIEVISNILKILSKDNSPAVLIELPNTLSSLPNSESKLKLEICQTIYGSGIWQAKSVLITNIDKIFKPSEISKDFLKTISQKSSSDPVSTIRASIARQLSYILESNCFGSFDSFQEYVTSLIADHNDDVRISVAESLGKMKNAPKEFMDVSLTLLLSDSEQEVKMEALKSVAATGFALKAASQRLMELITIRNWRVKRDVAMLIPKIAATMDKNNFNNTMMKIVKSLLSDDANDVRNATIEGLKDIAKTYGNDWIKSVVKPIIEEMYQSNDYQIRKTAVIAAIRLDLVNDLDEMLKKAVSDQVPNVRLILAKELPKGSKLLESLKVDNDVDVAYCASQK
ncbi:ARM repeat-containing protein [Histomonas meleagridis]|uniref:ARM repeat-containing protein n=1 Tax=Histomonas meleagridis TaxID=135588 RepID=UPI00355A2E1D|nr:ARM repeat-containing protein [Histomonas meleagridis]KAH0803779.1 ARM repeat-containing protein [Histomonas meleagridis]